MTVVLDASALLAYLLQEPGTEVVRKALSAGVDVEGMRDDLQALGMQVEHFWPWMASEPDSCGPTPGSRA